MRIFLLGATGRTGKHILEEALNRDHQVKALVRQKNRVHLRSGQLQLLEGLPTDRPMLEAGIQDCDAVLFALNVSRTWDWPWARLRSPENLVSHSIRLLIDLMEKKEVKRIISISAWGANETREELPSWFDWLIRNSNIRYPYQDHERHEELLKKSDLEFTILRPSGLTNGKGRQSIQVSFEGNPPPSLTISRKGLATFMLDVLEENKYIRQLPTVSKK